MGFSSGPLWECLSQPANGSTQNQRASWRSRVPCVLQPEFGEFEVLVGASRRPEPEAESAQAGSSVWISRAGPRAVAMWKIFGF